MGASDRYCRATFGKERRISGTMAPLLVVDDTFDTFLVVTGAASTLAVMVFMLVGLIICGCCDEKPKRDESKRKSTKLPVPSSERGSTKANSAEVKELARRYRVSDLEMQTLIDRFNAIDLNKDGSLTEAELVEAVSKLDQPITREQAAKFIKQYDKNGDGSLQLDEFLTVVTRRRKWSQPDADKAALKAFKEFDKNNDGHISPAELCQAMTEMGDPISVEEAAEMIKMADKNKDGRISYEEFVEFWKQYAVG